MVDIMISNARVQNKIIGYSAYTDTFHHGLSADLMENKWSIGLDNKNLTI